MSSSGGGTSFMYRIQHVAQSPVINVHRTTWSQVTVHCTKKARKTKLPINLVSVLGQKTKVQFGNVYDRVRLKGFKYPNKLTMTTLHVLQLDMYHHKT
jgi:hypothetical protein